MVAAEARITVREKLEQWSRLDAQRRRLEASIEQRERYLERLRQSLSASVYRSPVIDGMPRGTDVGDPVGNHIARTVDRIERLTLEVEALRQELDEVMLHLGEIEQMVSELREEYQKVITMYYRDRAPLHAIEAHTSYSKSAIYKILDIVAEAMEPKPLLWR